MLALTELQMAQNRADAVIGLLARAEVAPLPPLYELAYDYVAGVQTLGALRVGSAIDVDAPLDSGTSASLYEEFVRPYECSAELGQVVGQMVERLAALDAMLGERQDASRSHARSLADARVKLEGSEPNRQLMHDWIVRLVHANEMAARATRRLEAELQVASEQLDGSRAEMARLRRDALIDPVTGVANRAGLDGFIAAAFEEAQSRSAGGGLGFVVVDIDHYKRFNDAYGHQVGDAVLRIVARALVATVRHTDAVGRTGGDEFVVVLRDTDPAAAHATAEAMRRAIIESDLTTVLGPGVLGSITASLGVSYRRDSDTIGTLIERADRCLFAAKNYGRNRVVGDDARPERS